MVDRTEATKGGPVRFRADGPLEMIPVENGPLHLKGDLEILAASGELLERVAECWLCRCGQSGKKPFCDGTHRKVGFVAPGRAPVWK
ncbi:MAG: hypothetical protein CMLOHMNK_02508 [Steroidobacteraceae bacterium]|nr:hypothetical protein [Steroidobacteraceae bacterium]